MMKISKTNNMLPSIVFICPTLSFLGHKGILIVLVSLLLVSIFTLACRNNNNLFNFRPVAFLLFSAVVISLPNVMLDGGRMAALDAPSRYFISAIIFLGLVWKKISVEVVFKGVYFASAIAFLIFPFFLLYINGHERYGTEFLGETVNILSVAYFALIYMNISLVGVLYYFEGKNRIYSVLGVVSFVLFFLVGLGSGSKVVLLGLIVSLPLLIMIVFKLNRKMSFLIIIVAFFTILFGLQTMKNTNIYQRAVNDIQMLGTDDRTSTNLRIEMIKSGVYSFLESPLFGLGYNHRIEFQNQLVEEGKVNLELGTDGKHSLHNELINSAAKKGLIGVAFILAMYTVPLFVSYRLYKHDSRNRIPYFMMLSFIASLVVIGFTEAPLMGTTTSSFIGIWIVIFCLTFCRGKDEKC